MHLHKAREIRYKFIYDNRSEFHVEKMCEALDIRRNSYYAWLKRPMAKRKKDNALLAIKIKEYTSNQAKLMVLEVPAQLKKDE